jgi:AbrB family looped-hinge helix DNA binding protein
VPKKKNVDGKKLIEMIKKGTEQSQIMKKFGFENATQLKVAYANALMEEVKAPQIQGPSKAIGAKKDKMQVKVTKRGSISIPKDVVEMLGMEEGDRLEVRKTKSGISLRQL